MSPRKGDKDGMEKHHLVSKKDQKECFGYVYDNTTAQITVEDHQRIHRDKNEAGNIVSLARQDIREALRHSKKNKPF